MVKPTVKMPDFSSADSDLSSFRDIFFKALQEIIGKPAVEELIKKSGVSLPEISLASFSPSQLSACSQVFTALEQSYGKLPSLGIAQRAGRVFFHHSMKKLRLFSPLKQMDFLLLPPTKKFKQGFQYLSEVCSSWFHEKIETIELPDEWIWIASGTTLTHPLWLAWQKGLLYGAAYHFSQGKVHLIEEKERTAASCQAVLSISKNPLAY